MTIVTTIFSHEKPRYCLEDRKLRIVEVANLPCHAREFFHVSLHRHIMKEHHLLIFRVHDLTLIHPDSLANQTPHGWRLHEATECYRGVPRHGKSWKCSLKQPGHTSRNLWNRDKLRPGDIELNQGHFQVQAVPDTLRNMVCERHRARGQNLICVTSCHEQAFTVCQNVRGRPPERRTHIDFITWHYRTLHYTIE